MTRLVLVLAACAATPPVPDAAPDGPALTWREAYSVFFDAWCTSSERCNALGFHEDFGDHAGCIVKQVRDYYCHGSDAWCASAYPIERLGVLAECHADGLILDCWATVLPDSCWEALQ